MVWLCGMLSLSLLGSEAIAQTLPHASARSGMNAMEPYIRSLTDWIQDTAGFFKSFYGSMHVDFDEERLTNFLLQLESEREVDLVRVCLEHITKHYWTFRTLEEALILELRLRIEAVAGGKHVLYAPFGHLEDSSALLYASAFKGHNLDVRHLFEFLSSSHDRTARRLASSTTAVKKERMTPENTIICWLDDNVATGTQAPAIIGQYFGKETPQEEYHTDPLPPELQKELQKYQIVFAALYAQTNGIRLVNEASARLGLTLEALEPARSSAAIHYLEASTSPEDRLELTALLLKYGEPLLEDKVGWDENRRRKYALGYGGLGQLFLFCYQTPTSLPIMFWRYGRINNRFWKPLFWRESDYERFVKRLRLFDLHERTPEAAWDFYGAFGRARTRIETRHHLSLTIDHINVFYEFIRRHSTDTDLTLFKNAGEQPYHEVEAARAEQYFEEQLDEFVKRERLD